MAKIDYTDYGQASSSAFMGDFTDRNHVMLGSLAPAGDWTGLTGNVVPAGTLVGRTNAEKLAGADFNVAGDADDEIFIVAEDVDLDRDTGVNLVRHGSIIKYNFLPTWAGASATVKGKLHGFYTLIVG